MQKNLNNKMTKISDFIFYKTANGEVKLEVFLQDETVWLTQKMMAQLFEVASHTITYHTGEIYKNEELIEIATHRKIRAVQNEGYRQVAREFDYYNLNIIIAVGYRVNSKRATQFRIWATQVLKEYIIKGFVMDDERLKNPDNIFGKDYFEEQLARIRDIRSSERRFYQKITDIYAQCSADYDLNAEITKQFFATVQNKLHFAITGQTAAEIIYQRIDSKKPNMGLNTWKNAPKGVIRKTDVIIAKNYLNEKELDSLNRIVTMYLDYAEMQARKGAVMYMKDWIKKLDAFLQFNEKEILSDKGKISSEVALALAEKEYEIFHKKQSKNYISDFDIEVAKLLKLKN
ncbi:MAG: hypothetical protein UR28_C0003G0056 [Candidatus Peregrinibacteria bacterium GW2011_GWF2_33_10]|nr:MAG: hypothetical protein UR28_C0003G0056 [Candidatus Peregrinibacteria bacterium GW2011_GWF2_33_10]OGJ44207.1 MAG: cell filamentation protein Fic [Candidatus Peregrinibacteria bacterium RIFOXYA2_FULL_33_21]OGJ46691.1 MAG: cell filamentation protein Fic [Candidatus Peregrinibacteria bacterium RIFOXYA12_FULL_33_12]OGJ51836.1 MAG: cell filamentation protein Fic [Candidatus Peregrinibacteria bacterium RIFOXYB2_FULL_33_20]